MKNLILILVLVFTVVSCRTTKETERPFVKGLEHDMSYQKSAEIQPFQENYFDILGVNFYATENYELLMKELVRKTINPLTGMVEGNYSKYPFALVKVPNLTYAEITNLKGVVNDGKEIRTKVYNVTEKDIELPIELLYLYEHYWICFPLKSNYILNQLGIKNSELYKYKLIGLAPSTGNPTDDNVKIDVETGCKNLYVNSPNGIYVIIAKMYLGEKHEIWTGDGTIFMPAKVVKSEGKKQTSNLTKTTEKKTISKSNSCFVWYIVKKGDCCFSEIAKKFGMSLSEIIKLNPEYKCPNDLKVGDKIRIKQ